MVSALDSRQALQEHMGSHRQLLQEHLMVLSLVNRQVLQEHMDSHSQALQEYLDSHRQALM